MGEVYARTGQPACIFRKIGVVRWRTVDDASSSNIVAVVRNNDRRVCGIGRVGTPSDAVVRAIISKVGGRTKLHTNSSSYGQPVLLRSIRAGRFTKSINRISKSGQWAFLHAKVLHLICKISLGTQLRA